MSLVARITALAQTIAADIKALTSQLSGAGTWPIVDEDPADQEPGKPWLLVGVTADFVPLAVRCGFNRSSVPSDASTVVAQLSVLTDDGVVLRFNPSQVG
jgi:hypothetical protein